MNQEKDAAGRHPSNAVARTSKSNYPSNGSNLQGRFNRRKLPYPIKVVSILGIKPGVSNRAGYWRLRCPFHKGGTEQHPSLNLHQVNGNYRCHACHEKGFDILDFYRKVTGVSFVEAAKKLGCWEE